MLDVATVECDYVIKKYYRIPRKEITDKSSKILNFSGIVSSPRAEQLQALLKYETSNADMVDCILSAMSSSSRVVVSFDRNMQKLKAVSEIL